MAVNGNKRVLLRAEAIARIAPKIKELRDAQNLKQTEVAEACSVSSVQVSRWEKKLDLPGPRALLALAKLAPEGEAWWWVAEAKMEASAPPEDMVRRIPVLRDAAAAGTSRAVDEKQLDTVLLLPKAWLPQGGSIYGVKVAGDSMSPLLEDGYVALIDVASRDAAKLDGRMVAARDGDGITIKWLRKQSEDMYLLVPQHTSERHQVQVLRAKGDWSIVGEVVKWIGAPPAPRRVGRR